MIGPETIYFSKDKKKKGGGDKGRKDMKSTSDLLKIGKKNRIITKKFSKNIPEVIDLSESKIDTDKMFKNKWDENLHLGVRRLGLRNLRTR